MPRVNGFPEFATVEAFRQFLKKSAHLFSAPLRAKQRAIQLKPVFAAINAYLKESPSAKGGMEITEKILADLRAHGYTANPQSINEKVASALRTLRNTSEWGGKRNVRPAARRKERTGFKGSPSPILSAYEAQQIRHGVDRLMQRAQARGNSTALPPAFKRRRARAP